LHDIVAVDINKNSAVAEMAAQCYTIVER